MISWLTALNAPNFANDAWASILVSRITGVGAIYLLILTVIHRVTMFEMASNVILIRTKLAGMTVRNMGMPLDSAKLHGEITTTGTGGYTYYNRYTVYIENNKGKKYWIGAFSKIDKYDEFIEKLLKFVPITYIKEF